MKMKKVLLSLLVCLSVFTAIGVVNTNMLNVSAVEAPTGDVKMVYKVTNITIYREANTSRVGQNNFSGTVTLLTTKTTNGYYKIRYTYGKSDYLGYVKPAALGLK